MLKASSFPACERAPVDWVGRMYLDFDVIDIVFSEKLLALGHHDDAVGTCEGIGLHPDPKDEGGIVLLFLADA